MRPSVIFSLLAVALMALVVYSGMSRPPAAVFMPLPLQATLSPTASAAAPTPTLAQLVTQIASPGKPVMTLPADYRDQLILYAVVDRSDNVTRRLYITPGAIDAARAGASFPESTQIVIEAYAAAHDPAGNPLRDALGRLVAGTFDPEVHTAEMRSDWQPSDLASTSPVGDWNFDAIDFSSGVENTPERASCFNCHDSAFQTNFVFTLSEIERYAETGQTQYVYCDKPDRLPCMGSVYSG